MKKKLLTGSALLALIAIASLIAFNMGGRNSDGASLASTASSTQMSDSTSVDEVVQLDTPVVNDSKVQPEIAGVAEDQTDGTNEGIKVHGSWTIDVLEQDGTLVSHTEFENALETTGSDLLSSVLGHDAGLGKWYLFLDGVLGDRPCNTSLGIGSNCSIQEGVFGPFPNSTGGLLVEAPTTGTNAGKLVISGAIDAANDSNITTVETTVYSCATTSTPAEYLTCGSGASTPFTSASLSPTVAVLEGQSIQINVVISFS